jgi:hypothetical protein
MKNSSDIIGNRSPGLPACSTVPQPTAPPRAQFVIKKYNRNLLWKQNKTYIINYQNNMQLITELDKTALHRTHYSTLKRMK